jgi:uncharacterized protein YdhG (YjbR/CyaY superfamily)
MALVGHILQPSFVILVKSRNAGAPQQTGGTLEMNSTQQSTKRTTRKAYTGFSQGEKAAMRERAQELKAEARPRKAKPDGEGDALAKIAAMPAPFNAIGERLHAIIRASAPDLSPKTWYGLPAYAKGGKVVCYLRMSPQPLYNDRYLTFGFNETANLDQGAMWPIAFAVAELTADEEEKVAELVKKAAS